MYHDLGTLALKIRGGLEWIQRLFFLDPNLDDFPIWIYEVQYIFKIESMLHTQLDVGDRIRFKLDDAPACLSRKNQ